MKEIPIELVAYSRFKNKEFLKGKKASICACGDTNYGFSIEINCEECGEVCYYTPDNLDLKKKDAKKICIKCLLKNHREELSKEMIKLLEKKNMPKMLEPKNK